MTGFHASAPVRLDFAGAWTDVAPFALEERGVVVSAAIDLRAHAEVALGGACYRLRSDDLGDELELPAQEPLARDGRLDLLKAALRMSATGPCALHTWSDAPAGSGLGSSGALDVALLAALAGVRGTACTPADLAEAGYCLETIEAGHAGGKQDQYAAAFGGFNRFEFSGGQVKVRPLELDAAFAADLARRTIVCYTGKSRVSSDTIVRVMSAYSRKEPQVIGALRAMVEIAERMADALHAADLSAVGTLLSANWNEQQRLCTGMRTAEMAVLETVMAETGSLGGKAAGAGAGGSMFFVVGGDPARAADAARGAGATVLPLRWANVGVRTE